MDKDTQRAYQKVVDNYNQEIPIGSTVKRKLQGGGKQTKWEGPYTVETIKLPQNKGKIVTIVHNETGQRIECDMDSLKANDRGYMQATKTAQRILSFGYKSMCALLL